MSCSEKNYEKYIVSISATLKESLSCPKAGHKNKPLEYVCLSPEVTDRFACFHCLLDEYS